MDVQSLYAHGPSSNSSSSSSSSSSSDVSCADSSPSCSPKSPPVAPPADADADAGLGLGVRALAAFSSRARSALRSAFSSCRLRRAASGAQPRKGSHASGASGSARATAQAAKQRSRAGWGGGGDQQHDDGVFRMWFVEGREQLLQQPEPRPEIHVCIQLCRVNCSNESCT
jgi:hypothetical protein